MYNIQRLYHISDDRSIALTDEYELEKGEDAPMSMAAHPAVSIGVILHHIVALFPLSD